MVPMLWISSADKAEEPEVQGKASGKGSNGRDEIEKNYA